jgi:hypothetical protein
MPRPTIRWKRARQPRSETPHRDRAPFYKSRLGKSLSHSLDGTALEAPYRALSWRGEFWPAILVHRFPVLVRIEARYRRKLRARRAAQVGLVYNTVLVHHERVHSADAIFGRPGQQRESAQQ